jgi:hypothetical protein
MYVNGNFKKNLMDRPNYSFMLDSGTTYIWLPPTPFFGLMSNINDYCKGSTPGKKEKRCIGLSTFDTFDGKCSYYNTESGLEGGITAYLNSYPELQFRLGSMGRALFTLHPREYMVVYPASGLNKNVHRICPAFRKLASANDKALIGN